MKKNKMKVTFHRFKYWLIRKFIKPPDLKFPMRRFIHFNVNGGWSCDWAGYWKTPRGAAQLKRQLEMIRRIRTDNEK